MTSETKHWQRGNKKALEMQLYALSICKEHAQCKGVLFLLVGASICLFSDTVGTKVRIRHKIRLDLARLW